MFSRGRDSEYIFTGESLNMSFNCKTNSASTMHGSPFIVEGFPLLSGTSSNFFSYMYSTHMLSPTGNIITIFYFCNNFFFGGAIFTFSI